jgi:hypothetical protein
MPTNDANPHTFVLAAVFKGSGVMSIDASVDGAAYLNPTTFTVASMPATVSVYPYISGGTATAGKIFDYDAQLGTPTYQMMPGAIRVGIDTNGNLIGVGNTQLFTSAINAPSGGTIAPGSAYYNVATGLYFPAATNWKLDATYTTGSLTIANGGTYDGEALADIIVNSGTVTSLSASISTIVCPHAAAFPISTSVTAQTTGNIAGAQTVVLEAILSAGVPGLPNLTNVGGAVLTIAVTRTS